MTKHVSIYTRQSAFVRILYIAVVVALVVLMIVHHNDDTSMLVVFGLAALLTLLSEIPHNAFKRFLWTPACVVFALGCFIAAVVRSTYNETWDPFEIEDEAGDVLSLFLISFWIYFVLHAERGGVHGIIYHKRKHYNRDIGEGDKGDDEQASGNRSSAPADTDAMAQV
jgi:preprotein translocase subunit SecG